ncbi:biopolymer transporter TonB [Methylopila jiangsuensis]|uniref:Biopolymer transporter TonB n=1 Tax=Methylopila jiangsuensis TaxID=586230 RepID=A0A9W6N2A4_9HYPH|nr:energy transducer TonB [Methylopila jiangsuensis]MDR6285971.1 protein TonB [Methylopila jiangsuensis]GLK75729.1 biopolymer transporter TonB [Methylopila jiangsuensis]
MGRTASIAASATDHDVLRWTSAALWVVALHAGVAWWALRSTPIALPPGPPPAIMIDLAPLPEAVATDAEQSAPDEVFAEAAEAAAASRSEAIPDEAETEEPDEIAEATTDDAIEPELPELEAVEVPLPTARPEVRRTLGETPLRPKPRKPRATPSAPSAPRQASADRQQASAPVAPSDRTAASASASGAAGESPVTWQARLMAHLERRKLYPSAARARGETGTAYVRFRIDGKGNVLSVSLARSSGHSELDQAVLSLVRRASPVPAPPPRAQRMITAPVHFSVR